MKFDDDDLQKFHMVKQRNIVIAVYVILDVVLLLSSNLCFVSYFLTNFRLFRARHS